MIIKDIAISNLFSFERSEVNLGKYNVITGYNGAGKSNLIRLLNLIILDRDNGFDTCYVEDDDRFQGQDCSWIKIGMRFSDVEMSLISTLIFRNKDRKIDRAEFVLIWEGLRDYQTIKYAFILENKLIIWKDGSQTNAQTKFGILNMSETSSLDDLFISLNVIRNFAHGETVESIRLEGNHNVILHDANFQGSFFRAKQDIERYFVINGQRTCGIYNQDKQRQFDEHIYKYCEIKFNRGSVNLWILLANIFYRNLLIISENRPSIQQLKEDINELKSKGSLEEIKQLQEDFTSLFPGYSFDVESNTEINFTITRGRDRFRLKNCASGYIEVLYMLNLLRQDNRGIVILDEPALHMHPIKQKHFWRVVSEKNNNQIIAITHSPYLVNLRLFDYDNRLINIQMTNGVSQIFPKTTNLSPVELEDYSFKPEIFFSKCNILVEGAGEEAALAAILERLNKLFDKLSIHIMNVGGKDTMEKYVPILEAYSIPHVALVDYDYFCDNKKKIDRKTTHDFIILPKRLEEELSCFEKNIAVISKFNTNEPCKTKNPDSITPHAAYHIVLRAMLNQKEKVKFSYLGKVVDTAISKAGGNPDDFWASVT
jgi:predicted ATP-dependent endonuclease of OLD family